ncbi:MAG: tRNA (adenosine(37)-N6)-threonylcarbamoyltransferase complex dimerization subunit type 1 TsaB [Gammaproteobacteria bacterium]|nr:tRNA (adenosine(37)-N6)-threonylcarbamoyltransferase complex dimerization subunit type 1 TsaB [Gammaproteobacteria bacterium]
MPRILAMETSGTLCSVAIGDGSFVEESNLVRPREHHALILPMVAQLLARCGWSLRELDAIAFGRGPGSFTGLRIAASTVQGLAFGSELPVIPVSSLDALATGAHEALAESPVIGTVVAAIDAHMGELYAAVYDRGSRGVCARVKEGVWRVAAFDVLGGCDPRTTALAGDAWSIYPQLLAADAPVVVDAAAHARHVLRLAADIDPRDWLDPAQAEPVYLRGVSVWKKSAEQPRR